MAKSDDIKIFIEEDLSEYDQENLYPMSKTVVFSDGRFRHYELGPIVGYVLWGLVDNGKVNTQIAQIEEDDEFWFAPENPIYMHGSWVIEMTKTLDRMNKWYKDHIFEGFRNRKWVSEVKKEIVEETIYKNKKK